jgi:transcriptional regulator with XRE-family HTH domain
VGKMLDFGTKLKELRKGAGMTQTTLANRLNMTKSIVSYYEHHERAPSPEVMIRLSEIFHVTTDYLLGVNDKKMIDVTDLDDEAVNALLIMIEVLKN